MPTLPQFQGDPDDSFQLMQNQWGTILNPVINNPLNRGIILQKVALASGTTVVNHLLGRKLQGWKIVRQRALASIYDNQDNCQTPEKTLILISSAAVVCDIEVF